MAPVSLQLCVVGIAAIAGAPVENGLTGIPEKNTIVVDGKPVARAVQVRDVHHSVAVEVEHNGCDTANIAKGKVHPPTVDGQIPNGSFNLID